MVKFLLNKVDSLNEASSQRVKLHGAQYELFGVFAFINYIVPYSMWSSSSNSNFGLLICMRLLAGGACFLLIVKDHWIPSLAKYLPLYWHMTLLYCLPFLTTFMLFDSQGSTYWLLNMILAMLLLAVLVDWRSFITILSLGVISGYSFFMLTGRTVGLHLSSESLSWACYMCFYSFLVGILFSRRNEKIAQERLEAYKYVSASIAHEMRTPLSTMYNSAQGLKTYLPSLLNGYQLAKDNKLSVPEIHNQKLQILKDFPDHFITVSRRTLSLVDIFLTKFGTVDNHLPLEPISIKHCIDRALLEYPFYPEEQKQLVQFQTFDFTFYGEEALTIHLFSNLLKNSLHQIAVANRGEIRIWASKDEGFNVISFYDNASGIKVAELGKIFDRFYSSREHGTGIGLAYCKRVMELFGGKILCRSQYGEYTEFQLYFPAKD